MSDEIFKASLERSYDMFHDRKELRVTVKDMPTKSGRIVLEVEGTFPCAYENVDGEADVVLPDAEAVRLAVALIQATEGERLDHLVEVIGGNRNVLHVSLGEDDRDAKVRAGLALIRAAGGK